MATKKAKKTISKKTAKKAKGGSAAKIAATKSTKPRSAAAKVAGKGPLPAATGAYAVALAKLGVLEGPLGRQVLSPELVPIVQAFHAVLAGGKLSGPIPDIVGGSPQDTAELDRLLGAAIREANAFGATQPPGVILMWV